MQLSTLRSTNRDDEKSDSEPEETFAPRLTRSRALLARSAAPKPTSTASTQPVYRSRPKRARSPVPDDESSSGPAKRPSPPPRPLSVIPTMLPVTYPDPNDSAVRTLGLAQAVRSGGGPLGFDPEMLVRMREGHFRRSRPERKTDINRNWRHLSLSEAAWIHLEEVGWVGKGRGWTAREGCHDDGKPVKPELPYVILTKLVIASSPRKMLTLNQIYQAMEERWPFFRTLGQTFRNSIRHNLSMNPAFENVERPVSEGGMGTGKGGYWRVTDEATSTNRSRAKKPRIESPKVAVSRVNVAHGTQQRPRGGVVSPQVQKKATQSAVPVSDGLVTPPLGLTQNLPQTHMYPPPAPPLNLQYTDVHSANPYIPTEVYRERQIPHSPTRAPPTDERLGYPPSTRESPGHPSPGYTVTASVPTGTQVPMIVPSRDRDEYASYPHPHSPRSGPDQLHPMSTERGGPGPLGSSYPTPTGVDCIDPNLEVSGREKGLSDEDRTFDAHYEDHIVNRNYYHSPDACHTDPYRGAQVHHKTQLPTPPYEPSQLKVPRRNAIKLPPMHLIFGDSGRLPGMAHLNRPLTPLSASPPIVTPPLDNMLIPTPPSCS